MQQVVQNMRTGELSVKDVPPPTCADGDVLVATEASLISAGTEKMVMDFANKSLVGKAKERPDLVSKVVKKLQRDGVAATMESVFARLEEPLPLGYSAAGRVIATGANVHKFKVGDKVVVAGAKLANHAEVNAVPQNLVAPCPAGISAEEASFATLIAIAMHGVRNSNIQLGDRVLVLGLGLIGQLAAQLATIAGGRVCAMDFNAERLDIVKETGGAELTHNLKSPTENVAQQFTNGRGFDVVLICAATDSNQPIQQAADLARDRAKVVMVGKVGTEIPYADYMKKELQFVISRSYGPGRYDTNFEEKGHTYPIGFVPWTETDNLAEGVRLIAAGKLNISPLITHSYSIENALEAYEVIQSKHVPCLGVVLNYPNAEIDWTDSKKSSVNLVPNTMPEQNAVGVGFIGAGAFAKGVLLPGLKKCTSPLHFTGIASKGGLSARGVADKFGFQFATNNIDELFKNDGTQAVFIATRHNQHAQQVTAALNAKKHVFVEKPLALTFEELTTIKKAHSKSATALMVGYNRRFSPHMVALKQYFDTHAKGSPRTALVRVAAENLPTGNWQDDITEGGGRLLGEVCHFLDVAYYLIGTTPVSVHTQAGEGQCVLTITITFADKSTATVIYTSEGDQAFGKEYIELFGGGLTGISSNFQHTKVAHNGKIKTLCGGRFSKQNKGHMQEINHFIRYISGVDDKPPMTTDELFLSAALPLFAQMSLTQQQTVTI